MTSSRDDRLLRLAAAGAAVVMAAAVCAAAIGWREGGVAFQPGETHATEEQFARAIGGHASAALRFFAADTALAIGYLAVFAGLHAATRAAAPRRAALGLAAGCVMVASDLWENAFYVKHALAALAGARGAGPDLPLLYAITDLKEGAAWAAALLFGLAVPARRAGAAAAVRFLLILVPAVGLASLLAPSLVRARGWTLILPMPFLLLWFARRDSGR